MTNLGETKSALRARLRTEVAGLDPASLRDRSAAACERLAATEAFHAAKAIMIYLPLRNEVDPRPLAQRAWERGKTIIVPRVVDDPQGMVPVVLRSLDEPMEADACGMRAPAAGEVFAVGEIDLVVTPGLAFDARGYRLGRGGGHYDRFLAQPGFRGEACALIVEEQLIEHVPREPHDVPVAMIVTDQRTILV